MALRDKLRERSQPFLEPGEQIQQVFMGQTGPSPYFAALTYLIFFWVKYRVVLVTDRAVVVLKSSVWVPAKPKEVVARLPRSIRFGPMKGLWGKTTATGEKMSVHKRFHKDVEAADAQLDAWASQGYAVGDQQAQPQVYPTQQYQQPADPQQGYQPPPT